MANLLFIFSIATLSASHGLAACVVHDRQGKPVSTPLNDPLFKILTRPGPCPQNVHDFRSALAGSGAQFQTAMVGNRGFHNASQGSFSLFEMPRSSQWNEGEFFFGHFTAPATNDAKLTSDQSHATGSLMIELIVWDPAKKVFNFYELRGTGAASQWVYQGDSLDILADVESLHRSRAPGQPAFGNRLRCSGCHIHGGPILKELAAPHNDWWRSSRPLPLAHRVPDAALAPILTTLADADVLAKQVRLGMSKLEQSSVYNQKRRAQGLQQLLRPLFAPMEIQFESDLQPNVAALATLSVPSGLFVDPRLGSGSLSVSRGHYESALHQTASMFPETTGVDADHAWLTPVKARSDIEAVETLVREGIITRQFAMAVLAVDFTDPVFSPVRAELLKLLPAQMTTAWEQTFVETLRQSKLPGAQELLLNLTDPARTPQFHEQRVQRFLQACAGLASDAHHVRAWLRLLQQRRAEVSTSEISQNPRGQILEPGFRVIFPTSLPVPTSGALHLTQDCRVVEVAAACESATRH